MICRRNQGYSCREGKDVNKLKRERERKKETSKEWVVDEAKDSRREGNDVSKLKRKTTSKERNWNYVMKNVDALNFAQSIHYKT